ncbi:WGR domain-containing protein [Leptospira santarosai]|uniref:WGR domain-containing protein n=1 Tax=Leptospira santarosai TaxID=28183 RepID=UPI0024AFCB8D|nr:WGR domain-containing protein [Leptospira santarosai]MDI7237793.1 WGR domain-containing protein [Leptospira santarosai]
MKYFMTCKDDGSNKFWYMKVDGISFTVTFGETGTTGETYTKSYESEEACLKEVKRKLLRLKKNGYVEGNATLADTKSATLKQNPEPSNDYLKAWGEICNAKNLQLALIDHFSYLADSPGFEDIPQILFAESKSVSCTKEQLTVIFRSGEILRAYPPKPEISAEYPESYKKLLARHKLIELERARLKLGDHKQFEVELLEDIESELLEITEAKNIICPLWDYSDCWLYHPEEKNMMGEPNIHYLCHEGGDIENATPYNAGALFLRRCCESLKIKFAVAEI